MAPKQKDLKQWPFYYMATFCESSRNLDIFTWASVLFYRVLNRWFLPGVWAGLEDLRCLHSCEWHFATVDWKSGLSWTPLPLLQVASGLSMWSLQQCSWLPTLWLQLQKTKAEDVNLIKTRSRSAIVSFLTSCYSKQPCASPDSRRGQIDHTSW